MDGREMFRRIAAGDDAAMRLCMARHGRVVNFILASHRVPPSEREDAAQDVWLKVFRVAGLYDPARALPQTFVSLVARNVARDRLRRARASVRAAYGVPADNPGIDGLRPDPRGWDGPARVDDADEAERELLRLTPRERDVVRLCGRGPYATAALILGRPLNTIKTTLHKIRLTRRCVPADPR